MAPSTSAKQRPKSLAQAATSLILHIELPALEQHATLHFALEPSKTERVFSGLYDFVSGISREWDDELLEFDLEGTEIKLETLRANVESDLDSWNKKVKDAEEWRRKVENAATTMNKMRDAYFKELFHLREQVYRKEKAEQEGTAFQPEYALHFDPGKYTFDDEVARLVDVKTSLLEQEFQTKVDELEVRNGARIKTLTDQLMASKMSSTRKDRLLDKVKQKFGWDNQKLQDMLNCQKVNEEKMVTKVEARAEEAEQLALTAFRELAEKQANSQEVYAEAQAMRGFLERKYGSLKDATAQLSQKYELEQRMGLSEFQEFTDHISYVADAKRVFVRLSAGNMFISLGELMERLRMPPPPKAEADASAERKIQRRRSANDVVELGGDMVDSGSGGGRRHNIDSAIATLGSLGGRRRSSRGRGLGRIGEDDGFSSDSGSECSGVSEISDANSVSPQRSLIRGRRAAPDDRRASRSLKVSCEVMTDVTFDSGAQAAFSQRDPLKKDTADAGCDARPYDASFQKRRFQSRGCQSRLDGNLLDRAVKLLDAEVENNWTELVGLDVEDVPDPEDAVAQPQGAVSSTKPQGAVSSTKRQRQMSRKKQKGKSVGTGSTTCAEADAVSGESSDDSGDDDYEEGETDMDGEGQEREAEGGAGCESGAASAATNRSSRRRNGSFARQPEEGDEEERDSQVPPSGGRDASTHRDREASSSSPGAGGAASAFTSEGRSLSPVPPHGPRSGRVRGRAPPGVPTLGSEEDELLPPTAEPSSRIKKALGQAMSRHVPGIGAMSMGAMFGGQARTKFEQTGGTGETGDPVVVRVPSCDVGVQTDLTPEQALSALDWEPSQDIPSEERLEFLLHLTQEIESRVPKIWEQAKMLVGQQPSSVGDRLVRRLARWPISEFEEHSGEKVMVARPDPKRGNLAEPTHDEPPSSRHTFGGALGQRRTFDGRNEPMLRASVAVGDGLVGDGLPDGGASVGLNNFRFRSATKQLTQPGRDFVDDHVLGLRTPAGTKPILRKQGRTMTVHAMAREEQPEDDQGDGEPLEVSRSVATTARRKTGMDRVQALVEEAKRKSANYTSEANYNSEADSGTNAAPDADDDALAPGWSGLVPRVSFSSKKVEVEVEDQVGSHTVNGAERSAAQESFTSRSLVKPVARKPGAGDSLEQGGSVLERKSFGVGRVSFGVSFGDSDPIDRQRQTEPILKRGGLAKSALKANKLKHPADGSEHPSGPLKCIDDTSDTASNADDGPQYNVLGGDLGTSPRRPRGLPTSEHLGGFRQEGGASGSQSGETQAAVTSSRRRGAATKTAPPPGDRAGSAADEDSDSFLPPVLPLLSSRTDRGKSSGQGSSSTTGQFSDGLDSAGVQVRIGTSQGVRSQRSQLARQGSEQASAGGQRPAAPSRGGTHPPPEAPSALRVEKQPTLKGSAQGSQGPARDLLSDAPSALRVDKQPTSKGAAQTVLPEVPSSKGRAPPSRDGARRGTHAAPMPSQRMSSDAGADMERVTFSGVLPSSRESNLAGADDVSPKKRGGAGGASMVTSRASFGLMGHGGKAKK